MVFRLSVERVRFVRGFWCTGNFSGPREGSPAPTAPHAAPRTPISLHPFPAPHHSPAPCGFSRLDINSDEGAHVLGRRASAASDPGALTYGGKGACFVLPTSLKMVAASRRCGCLAGLRGTLPRQGKCSVFSAAPRGGRRGEERYAGSQGYKGEGGEQERIEDGKFWRQTRAPRTVGNSNITKGSDAKFDRGDQGEGQGGGKGCKRGREGEEWKCRRKGKGLHRMSARQIRRREVEKCAN
ncbi:hypothetical protein E2C01_079683 [Portunus trituberculatus]|uniref:Uncharacterized protein n=1 Tax=Portunus trituberculatus TaxID=210409 RepID=A0A5B7IS02_PORTR|nr:hypothetical protein [Portunus trituberculatus]